MADYNKRGEKILMIVIELPIAVISFVMLFFMEEAYQKVFLAVVGITSALKALYNYKTIPKK